EIGTELRFFNDRLGIDAAYYRSKTVDQIVSDLRLSYGTGFILQVFNGGELWNEGIELQLNGTPVSRENLSWEIIANFTTSRGELVSLPNDLPEYYVSDTWLAGNIRNGVIPGESLYNLTGFDYRRNDRGDILIDPDTGLPLRAGNIWVPVGDRNPDFTVGLSNFLRYKNFELSFLLDIRKGGDIYNGTAQYMFANGLSLQTLDREEPVVIEGVLADGNENSANPTPNNIEIVPYENSDYYTAASGVGSEINFVERDINWLRLRDVTLRYRLPAAALGRLKFLQSASLFLTATDLFILTNYTGLDPVNVATSTAVGGSGGMGIDYGNYPMPLGINIGLS
ncbi:MAG TPA: TonB-dependent receptor, partial [Anseongella sp.]|nr:TonB-dependent receptor [Anseongella sp.]